MTHNDSAERSCQRETSPLAATLRNADRWQFIDDTSDPVDLREVVIVLRLLIEEFGGEAVNSTLSRRVLPLITSKQAKPDQSIRRIIGELEQCGAVTLEEMTSTDAIVRIQRDGVILAYDLPK